MKCDMSSRLQPQVLKMEKSAALETNNGKSTTFDKKQANSLKD